MERGDFVIEIIYDADILIVLIVLIFKIIKYIIAKKDNRSDSQS